ncbi:PREDICTED: uncharacterized protein LOC109241832 isoform X1 [Nicotiana attenuata]|uniref:SHSP domain-containing protein n=1 Tax=Nicotiana attenuata TaxID=49451 RepID=A0A1J6JNZ8_NICAT|nr:PREDICTED: uncharacterized protein LOC109241832 isoform X1 [Nicotiana attenuata]OIT08617.1 hypothetical protein A4A49_15433 [Nicotiana attenuata]
MEANVGKQAYSEFDPYSEWQKEEFYVLIVRIPEFTNKQGLKVQISNLGVVKISGDRQVGFSRIRFYKEFPIPKDCNTDEIQAKLAKGSLKISFPKKFTAPPPLAVNPKPDEETTPTLKENNSTTSAKVEDETTNNSRLKKIKNAAMVAVISVIMYSSANS